MLPNYPLPTSQPCNCAATATSCGAAEIAPAVCPICHGRRTERGRADIRRDVNIDTARMRIRMAPDGTPDLRQGIPPGLSHPHPGQRQNHPFALLSTPSTVKRRLRGISVRGQPMIDRFRDIARALVAVLLLGMAGAAAQTAQSPTSPNPSAASQAGSVPTAQAPAQPAGPAGPQINIAEISARANRDVGVNIETAINGWQHELDRLESALQKPRLRYSELNDLRDELQRVRAGIEDFWKRLEPPLAAAKDQVALLGPAPAAGQPPEPEQAALTRAGLNYLFGLLSAGQAAVHSANLRIDQLINTIQDIRRKNFTTSLLQPVPGIYSYQTWANLPDYVPSATSRVRDLLVEWWDSVRDQNEVLLIGFEAILLWLVLTIAAWHGVHRLRRWAPDGEPPFWRRASSAAGVILLRIFAVNALVTTVFAPWSSQWRLIPASDRAAARICGLILTLAIAYGVTTLIYVVTRIVQAPFALTVAVAFPSSLLLAAIIVAILLTPLDGQHQERMPSLRWLTALRIPIWITVAAIVVCALGGYLALSRF